MANRTFNATDVRNLIKAACDASGSQRQFAADAGVSAAHLSSVISGRREPGELILARLGLVRAVIYIAA